MQLFSDDHLTNQREVCNSSKTVKTMPSINEDSQDMVTNFSSSLVPDDIKTKIGSFISPGSRVTTNITTDQSINVSKASSPVVLSNIYYGKNTGSEGVLPTKSSMSHQIKYVIPAEQPLEKTRVDEGRSKNTSHSLVGGEADSCKSLPTTSTQSWAHILGNMSSVNKGNSNNISVCVSADDYSILQSSIISPSTSSQLNKLQNQKDKAKKKKRISILERIYGDAIIYYDDCPDNNLGCGEMLYSNSTKLSSDDGPSSNSNNNSNNIHSVEKRDICKSWVCNPEYFNDNQSTPITQKTVKKLQNDNLPIEDSVGQLCSQFSSLQNLCSPSMRRLQECNPSTFVTYSRNGSNILYGDLTEKAQTKPAGLPSSSFSLMTFSNERNKDGRNDFENSPSADNLSRNAEFLGEVSVTTLLGKKESTDYNAFIVSPRHAKCNTQISPQIGGPPFPIKSSTMSNGNISIYSTGAVLTNPSSIQSEKKIVAETSNFSPQSYLRSEKLDKYVSCLLGSPASSLESKDILPSLKLEMNETPYTLSTNISNSTSHITLSPAIYLDNTNNSSECCSLLDESEICMVFSTPFKQGLRNHILHSNSFSNVVVHQDIPSETTNSVTITPSRNLHQLCSDDTSAFRRIQPTCNVFPKFVAPSTAINKSDEMQALFGIVSPTLSPAQYMRVEDAEISLYHQLGEISSRFHKEVVLRRGVQNPLPIILTTGDEMVSYVIYLYLYLSIYIPIYLYIYIYKAISISIY